MQNPLRSLPSVNELIDNPTLRQLIARANHSLVVNGARKILDDVRAQIKNASDHVSIPSPSELASRVAEWVSREQTPKLRPVINATGILLHTGLGRSPLAKEAVAAVAEIAAGYCTLEVDAESGERSQRVQSVEKLLCELTNAEAAVVVNNNAGATLLVLAAIAGGREVIVSRGQLIEIGGSFRLPSVMECSGATLREVGTTNKTKIEDYAQAIGERTGALMKVHPSNYVVVGFTQSATLKELVALGRKHQLPVIDDVGSGALFDFSVYGLTDEPVVSESIRDGADVVLFSGDKLIGGPQCGIIVGRKKSVRAIATHPLMRALRVDKMTLAALAETLRLYRDRDVAENTIPLLEMLSTGVSNLRVRAERLAPQLEALDSIGSAEVTESLAMLGGGSLPTQQLESIAIALTPADNDVNRLARQLRGGTPSVFGRVHKDRLWLDLRSVPPRHDVDLVRVVRESTGRTETAETR